MSAPPESMSSSPRFPALHPSRSLPKRENITDDSIADAYTHFILYCNPHFPLDIDASELKRIFRSPPRSDGKDISIHLLWELIQKFDAKEIKTWAQLALDLGVEPPSAKKGGSVQKVQQYSVRLKRWMRAMHVDAFFEYLLGKRHVYFMDLPPAHDPHPMQGRDGVPAEEDLALRALDPSFKPKRGRKRNESPDDEPAPSKRPLLTTSFTFEGQTLYAQPQSAHPASAIPLRARPDPFSQDPWVAASAVTPDTFALRPMAPQSAITTRPPHHLQWQHHDAADTPSTPYPMSAVEPGRAHSAFDEPRSAVTASAIKSRSRRKHGPAVSSAWPSSSASNSAKLRGRPPVNRSVQDGPFSTFPADPNIERTPSSQRATPVVALAPVHDERSPLLRPNTYTMAASRRESNEQFIPSKPERLQVQVPQHTGGPVRLATPTVLLNGQFNGTDLSGETHSARYSNRWQDEDPSEEGAEEMGYETQPESGPPNPRKVTTGNADPGFAYEALRRILASDLLRAKLSGRRQRILADEANRLATAMLARLEVPQADTDSKSDDAVRMAAASWLGVSSQLGFTAGSPCQEKEIVIHRFSVGHDGSQTPISADQPAEDVKEKYDVSWNLGFGGVGGRFCVVGIELAPEKVDVTDAEYRAVELAQSVRGVPEREVDWKSKFMALDMTVRLMKGQLNRLQDKVLDAIL